MKKSYIKMNNGNILSLGNIINSIKKISNNNNAMQTEIFCSIFGVNEINTTTVNNYCIGIRAIGNKLNNIIISWTTSAWQVAPTISSIDLLVVSNVSGL